MVAYDCLFYIINVYVHDAGSRRRFPSFVGVWTFRSGKEDTDYVPLERDVWSWCGKA
jgi:hypothetical protein